MKTHSCKSGRTQGQTYSTVFWTTVLVGLALVAVVRMVTSQNAASMRSQAWNHSIIMVEAGVEEALAHLNRNGTTNYDLAADGWTSAGTFYHKRGNLGDGYYDVYISSETRPQILCSGFVPVSQSFVSVARPMMAYILQGSAGQTYVYRNVQVKTFPEGMFVKGLVARHEIDLRGNRIRTDSFDSADPRYSTNGYYYAPWARDNGDVATTSGLTNSINIEAGNAEIFGRLATGPRGSVYVGSQGSVGSRAWHLANNRGIEPGAFTDDMNVSFPPVQEPFTTGYMTPSSASVNGTNYALVLGSGNYLSSTVNFSGSEEVLVTGAAVWRVTGDFSLSGSARIIIAPNASLMLYVGQATGSGTRASIGGNGVANLTGYSTNFIYFGLPSNTQLSHSGNAAFIGGVYAPNAAFSMNGGGNNAVDFMGAAVCAAAIMNGHYNFHYDEALGRYGPRRGYIISSWNEL